MGIFKDFSFNMPIFRKCFFYIFSIYLLLYGLAILVIGVLMQIGNQFYSKLIEDIAINVKFSAITLIVIGSVIFIIAFLGCCGAIRESHYMMVTFACLLLAILILQVAVAIFVLVSAMNTSEIDIKNSYRLNLFDKYKNNLEERDIVDTIQNALTCCGVDGPRDYDDLLGIGIPSSCCGKKESTCNLQSAYSTGCASALKKFLKNTLVIMGEATFGFATVELMGIIFALSLTNFVKNAQRTGTVYKSRAFRRTPLRAEGFQHATTTLPSSTVNIYPPIRCDKKNLRSTA